MTMHPTLFPVSETSSATPNIVVFPSLLHETMEMIFESYELFELHDAATDKDAVPTHVQSLTSAEMSRITMRLTSIMAWLMARKAVASGHTPQDSAVIDYQLEGEDYCLKANDMLEHLLPEYLVSLLDRSKALYERVWRLDKQSRA